MRKFIAAFLIVLTNSLCFAQANFFDNYVYQSWSSFNGLSGTTANDIYQTQDGYINIGTYEGLVQFDGVEFNTIINQCVSIGIDYSGVNTSPVNGV